MKLLSEKRALRKLGRLKSDYQKSVRENYEHRAQNCLTCPTPGACCTDAHFVNVHITRLEAAAIREALAAKFSEAEQSEIYRRAAATIEQYDLRNDDAADGGDTFRKTFACPLFEKGVGCLVHAEAKPAPCIQHACYERAEDLPPDELQSAAETQIGRLNAQTYRQAPQWRPLPLWLEKIAPAKKS